MLAEGVTVFDGYGLGEATGGDRELIEEANVAEEDKTIAVPVRDEPDRCSPFDVGSSAVSDDNALSPVVAERRKPQDTPPRVVRDYDMQAASDNEIFEYAQQEQRVLVSADTDFGTLLAARRDRPFPLRPERAPAVRLGLLTCAVVEVGLYPRAVAADEIPGALADQLRSLVNPTG